MTNNSNTSRFLSMLSKGVAFGLMSAALIAPLSAEAKPAYPFVINHELPDGSILPIRMVGDEYAHRIFTADGYLLSADNNGGFEYATLSDNGTIITSGVKAVAPEKRSAAVNSFLGSIDREKIVDAANMADSRRRNTRQAKAGNTPISRAQTSQGMDLLTSHYPSTGSPKALVILVQYKDVKFSTPNADEYFNNFLNQPGFSTNGATGSALDYFTENSNGKFTPEFDLLGPVTLPERQSYYGRNDNWGTDMHPEEMAIHALDILDEEIDFSQYDTDGDGVIDNVYIFYAGRGEADMGGANTVWPHSWEVKDGAGLTCIYDGVLLNRYACSNEIDNISNKADGIGTFVHEFSHVMGLPDLYETTYATGAFTPGSWSTLDYGPYNNEGRTPPNYGLFERYSLGWVEPAHFYGKATAEYTINPIPSNEGYLVKTEKDDEFFLIEVRNQEGWDTYIPNSGMMVWYIDYNRTAWDNNTVNNDPYRQRVNIIEADGSPSDSTRDGDCFPGAKNVTAFTADSYPAFVSRQRKPVNVEFTNIRRNADGSVTFTATHDVAEGSGVSNITDNNQSWSLSNRTIHADTQVSVFTPSGVRIASLVSGNSFELPAAGIYLINANGKTSKIVIR